MKKTEEKIEKTEKKIHVRKEATPLQSLLNEKMKQLRKSVFQVVKNFRDKKLTEEIKQNIETSFNAANDVLTSIKNEAALEKRFASLTAAEREFLKKMLNEN